MIRCPACGRLYPDEQTHCSEDGKRLPRSPGNAEDLIGTLVGGRYRVERLVGMGGMGAVYVARHERIDRPCALKLMHPSAVNQRSIARFVREARAASRVDHDNVIGIIDFGQAEEGYYFLVMEYVEGKSLDKEIDRVGAFPMDRALRVLAQVASALARAHQLGIVHRDLKPENILLTERGADADFVKIIDFGLAKALGPDADDAAPLTQEGDVFGTPEYMAPEQWRGLSVSSDHRVDIYAWGVLAYELVTGHLLFEGDVPALMRAHLSVEPIPPRKRRERGPVPERLEGLILRALAKEADDRPGSMDEVLTELRAIWDAQPARAVSLGDVPTLQLAAPDTLPDGAAAITGSVLDGPALAAEIQRLHALRGRRLDDLSRDLWGDRPPAAVAELGARLGELDAAVAREGELVALLRDRTESERQKSLGRQAELRGEIFDASLWLEDRSDDFDLRTTVPRGSESAAVVARRVAAERALASAMDRWDEELRAAEAELSERLVRLREMEAEIEPLVDRLSEEVHREARHRPELGPHLRELDRIHRAIGAFQSLLRGVGTAD